MADDPAREPALTAISLGGGVQSSVLALMAAEGAFGRIPDCAIFADTGWEPAGVYEHLDWLDDQLPFPVHRIRGGDIRADLLAGTNSTGQDFISVPAYSRALDGRASIIRRQCTREYKVTPIEKELRRLLGIGYRRQVPRGTTVEMWIGISTDEYLRMKDSRRPWLQHRWPLVDGGLSRQDCIDWFSRRYPGHHLPRSACIGCPYRTDAEWREMKEADSVSWWDAVVVDAAIRQTPQAQRFDGKIFLHRSRRPLNFVEFATPDSAQASLFAEECEGMCGV